MSVDSVAVLARDLRSVDTTLYVFQPDDDDTDHFVGEAMLIGAAGVLLSAFLKGVAKQITGAAEDAGEHVGRWLVDRFAQLFRGEEVETPVADEVAAVQASAAASGGSLDTAIAATRTTMIAVFVDRGADPTGGADVVDRVERAVRDLLGAGVT